MRKSMALSWSHAFSVGTCSGKSLLYYKAMETNFEIVKNILAILLSSGTLFVMVARYMNKERIEHAKQISDIIQKAYGKTFDLTSLESRVKSLERSEKENQEYMKESFAQINSRLDQIYSIIASIQK